MWSNLLFRLSTLARNSGHDGASTRVEVCPPADDIGSGRGTAANAGGVSLGEARAPDPGLLESTQPQDADTRLCPRVCEPSAAIRHEGSQQRELADARADMTRALADLSQGRSALLRERVQSAGSLRELWHLRPEVFNQIAVERDQSEAERRLMTVNRHFPIRMPRGPVGSVDKAESALQRRSRATPRF